MFEEDDEYEHGRGGREGKDIKEQVQDDDEQEDGREGKEEEEGGRT